MHVFRKVFFETGDFVASVKGKIMLADVDLFTPECEFKRIRAVLEGKKFKLFAY